jgi:thioredoxin 2
MRRRAGRRTRTQSGKTPAARFKSALKARPARLPDEMPGAVQGPATTPVTGAATIACTNCGKFNRVPPRGHGVPRCGFCHTALPWIVDADASSFDSAVDSSLPVLVDFWAAWCGPCRMLSPLVEQVARDDAGHVKVVKLDVDAAPEIAARFGAQSIPLLLLLRDGNEVDRLVGAVPRQRLRAWLEPHLTTAPTASP